MTDSKTKQSSAGRHTIYMIVAIVLAFVVAYLWPHVGMKLELGGEVFLRVLTMVVVPLVMASVMSGILGLGDVRKLGRPGLAAVGYYLTTTVLAVITGVVVVTVISPGVGVTPPEIERAEDVVSSAVLEVKGGRNSSADPTAELPKDWVEVRLDGKPYFLPAYEGVRESEPNIGSIFHGLLLMLFTDNLLGSMVRANLLPLIVFSIIFAGMLTTMGQRSETIQNLVVSVNDALMSFVMLLMKVAPLGIFCLVTSRFGEAFAEGQFIGLLQQLGLYMTTVLSGLAIHACITLPLFLWIVTRRNPIRFAGRMFDALLTAFSTASSSATLPVTMECAVKKAKVSKRSAEFVLPLGATINMDGTALYEAAAAIFIAQIYVSSGAAPPEFTLGTMTVLTIAVTATLAAIGAAGIPEAGLVTMLIVLNAVNLPVEYLVLILPVDWLLDRFRTMINAFGDSVGAAVVDRAFSSS